MTLKEAADKLGIAPGTLRMQIHNGALRSHLRGRDHWITPGQLEAYRRDHLGQRKGGRPKRAA